MELVSQIDSKKAQQFEAVASCAGDRWDSWVTMLGKGTGSWLAAAAQKAVRVGRCVRSAVPETVHHMISGAAEVVPSAVAVIPARSRWCRAGSR